MKSTVIYGPPGTGKTTYLVGICEKILSRSNNEILFLSHTKAAAKEAISRLPQTRITISTVHSCAFKIAKISKQQVIDWKKIKEFSKAIGIEINGRNVETEEKSGPGDEMLAIYNYSIATGKDLKQAYFDSFRPMNFKTFEYFISMYTSWKIANGYIDFNDMLIESLDKEIIEKFPHVLIDEAQDLSKLQWKVMDKVIEKSKTVHLAGDDDQAIYTWGGADPQGMYLFEKERKAKRIILQKSYRVPKTVFDLSQKTINNITKRINKKYFPTKLKGRVNRYNNIYQLVFDNQDTLILYRNHVFRKEIEKYLIIEALPYLTESGPRGLFQNKYANAIRSYLKVTKLNNSITEREVNNIIACSYSHYKPILQSKKFPDWPEWVRALNVPFLDYYKRVDLFTDPNIRISSIHGSKGREADRVILHSGMTQRTMSGYMKNPNSETRVFYVAMTRAKKQLDILTGNEINFDL